MTTLEQRATLAQDDAFRRKVQAGVIKSATYILADPAREFVSHRYAKHVSNNIGGGWLNSYVNAILIDGTIDDTTTDENLQYAIDANFDKMAKLHYANI